VLQGRAAERVRAVSHDDHAWAAFSF